MTRLEEIRQRLNSAKACVGEEAQSLHDLSYLLELVESQLEEIVTLKRIKESLEHTIEELLEGES